MQQHIDSQLVDGAYLRLETDTGEVVPLYPDTAHTIIFEMGEHFVLCYDFRDGEGSATVRLSHSIDISILSSATTSGTARVARSMSISIFSSFVVFHTSIGDRSTLKKLMKEGRVSRAD